MIKQSVALLASKEESIINLAQRLAPPSLDVMVIPTTMLEDDKIAILQQAQFLIWFLDPLTSAMVDAISHVKLVQLLSAGYDHPHVHNLVQRGIPVAHAGGANARSVAEYTIMLMLAVFRKLTLLHESTLSGNWQPKTIDVIEFQELSGKHIGILGFGRIGREVAKLLKGFETRNFYYDLYGPFPDLESALGVQFLDLDQLLKQADVLTIHLPLTPSTHHLLNADMLNLLKPNAIIINTSRGKVVDHYALIQALANGNLAGAGLDVFSEEPIPDNDPLLRFGNQVVFSPHRAGSTEQSWKRRLENAFGNIERVSKGLPALWRIELICGK
jgi:phosphoglycerate dehydrogenase-like enzyme